jgi:predicted dehydrogenase
MKTAIIGMGRMGRLRKELLERHDELELIAVCDIAPQVAYDVPCYTDWRQLLARENPEVVFVCTYNNVICDIVCECLQRGMHVFSEKPPGRNLQDALTMQAAAEKAPGQVLKFGFNHRLHNSVLEARAILDSGQLGEVVCARGAYGKAGEKSYATQWRSDREKAGGGILLDQGIHMLDLLLYFMGDLSLVDSVVENFVWKDVQLEDNAMAILRGASGRSALFHSSATQWRHLFRLELLCEGGYIHLEGLITSTMSYGEESVRIGYKDIGQITGKLGMPSEQVYYYDNDASWNLEMQEFVEALQGKHPIVHGTIDDAVRLMRLVEAIYSGRH